VSDLWTQIKPRILPWLTIRTLVVIVLVLLALSALWGWYRRPPVNTVYYTSPPEIREVVRVQKVYVPVGTGEGAGKVQVLNKDEVNKKMADLPPDVRANPNAQITSTGEIGPYAGRTNVANVIDTSTGVSHIVSKQVPLPPLGIECDREVGARVGYIVTAPGGTPSIGGNVYGKWDFLRIGKVHLGAYGEAGYYPGRSATTAEGKVMLQGSVRFGSGR